MNKVFIITETSNDGIRRIYDVKKNYFKALDIVDELKQKYPHNDYFVEIKQLED